jgi:hypothetical protein
MVNMKMSADKAKEYSEPQLSGDAPEYPYGLCLHLGMDELAKLGMTTLPDVGAKMTITAMAFVKSTSAYETQSEGKSMSVDLQITDMEVGSAEKKDPASVMYPEG